jgi:hypothetical protein
MSYLLTENFKIEMAKSVYDLIDLSNNSLLPESSKNYLFAVLGKQTSWTSEEPEVVPDPEETVNSYNQLFRNSLFAKRLTNADASFVVRRIDWKSNTVYDAYDDSLFDFDSDFYIMTSDYKVFKCLDNNSGAESIEEPDITLSSTSLEEPFVQTLDGYKWKYLYTLNSLQRQKYLTQEWMPVATNKFVSAAAINGSIDVVRVLNSGNNYTNGVTQNIISIAGDGTGATFRANVSGGQIQNVIIQNRGQNYTFTTMTVTDVSGGVGNGASVEAIISPQNGHGFDPIYELGASTLIFDCDFEGGDLSFIDQNDYRQVYILKNPIDQSTNNLANGEKYSMYYRIKTSPGLGNFNEDEVVYQGVTFESATFTADVVYFDEVQNFLYVNNIRGNLGTNQSIKGLSTGSIRIVNGFNLPQLKWYTGKVLYISNAQAVSRNEEQTDRVRFLLNF